MKDRFKIIVIDRSIYYEFENIIKVNTNNKSNSN